MSMTTPHPLDQTPARWRVWLVRISAVIAVVAAGFIGWYSFNTPPAGPLEIDAVIAPPIYANGSIYALTDDGQLAQNQSRILTLQPGARLMVRVKNAPGAPRIIWRDKAQRFTRDEQGTYWLTLTIDEPGVLSFMQGSTIGHDWLVSLSADDPPVATFNDKPFISSRNMIRFDIAASDDFGLGQLALYIAPASDTDIESDNPVTVPLNLIGGGAAFRDTVYVDLRDHALAGQMVRAWIAATDMRGQKTLSEPQFVKLPTRRFRVAEARILASQPDKLQTNPAKTPEVATILHTIATRHIDNDDLPAGRFLAFSVAYRRLTGSPLIDDKPFRPPLLPASAEQIDAASDLIMALATAIEDGPLSDTDRQFLTADINLQNQLTNDAAPEDQDVALWQYHFALSRHLPALLLNSLQRQGHFLPSPLGGDIKRDLKSFDNLTKHISADIEAGDWQRARGRLAIIRDLVHNAQAGRVSVERPDLLGLIAETGSMLSQISQLHRDVRGEVSGARGGVSAGDHARSSRAISVRPFAPLNADTAIARAEALYYRAVRRFDDDRISALLAAETGTVPIVTTLHKQAIKNLHDAQAAFHNDDRDAALSYLNQAQKQLAGLTQIAIRYSFAQATALPPTPRALPHGQAVSSSNYDRFMALLSAHRDYIAHARNLPATLRANETSITAQFSRAMNLTYVLPPQITTPATPERQPQQAPQTQKP